MISVVRVDPAEASLEVVRRKPGADAVRWVHTDRFAHSTFDAHGGNRSIWERLIVMGRSSSALTG